MKSILITGAAGQLGSELARVLSERYRIIPGDLNEFDITDFESVKRFVGEHPTDVIIHTAGMTDVDECERMRERALEVNGAGTRNVAAAAREMGASLFYISTDYVFDGLKGTPYGEDDETGPINAYGESKLLGERYVEEALECFYIIRIAWLYGFSGKNFIKTVLKLASGKKELRVVDDQRGSPTFTVDVARQIEELIPARLYGTYHCTSQGSCTRYELARKIIALAGLDAKVEPITSDELTLPAKRPHNSTLENRMLKLRGLDIMPRWEESLAKFVKKLKHTSRAEGEYKIRPYR